MITAILIGLTLILLTRKREFLTPTATIKDPSTWTDADVERVRGLSPELTRAFDEDERRRSGNLVPSDLEAAVKNFTKNVLTDIVSKAWTALYVPATTKLTPIDVARYVNSAPGIGNAPPGIVQGVKTLLNAYFETQEASVAPLRPSPTESAPAGMDVISIQSLEQEYQRLQSEYRSLITQALSAKTKETIDPLIQNILDLNARMTEVLDKLVARLAAEEAKGSNEFTVKRNEFALQLSRIKKDYSGLLSTTDQMTTLRRIREHEEEKATTGLKYYLIAFGVAVSLLIVVIFFKMFQPKKDVYATNPMESSPMTTPAFTA